MEDKLHKQHCLRPQFSLSQSWTELKPFTTFKDPVVTHSPPSIIKAGGEIQPKKKKHAILSFKDIQSISTKGVWRSSHAIMGSLVYVRSSR